MSERRSVVASGKTVEDAIKNGLAMLGLRQEQVDVEVISEGSRGVFGIGAEHARVRLAVKPPPAPPPAAAIPVVVPPVVAETGPEPKPEPPRASTSERRKTAPEAHKPPRRRRKPSPAAQQPPSEEPDSVTAELAKELLEELLDHMGIRASVQVQFVQELSDEGEAATMVLNLTGDDLGILIGRRGETLAALQYVLRLMISHRAKHWTNAIVDVESYRVRRLHALESLANRVAEEAVRTGRTQSMEPMPSDERRLVHMALRNHPKVTTQSVGEGERRKVTVVPRR
jgi:spoIIIJ-associated protein